MARRLKSHGVEDGARSRQIQLRISDLTLCTCVITYPTVHRALLDTIDEQVHGSPALVIPLFFGLERCECLFEFLSILLLLFY